VLREKGEAQQYLFLSLIYIKIYGIDGIKKAKLILDELKG
jgi:hypothetical protein